MRKILEKLEYDILEYLKLNDGDETYVKNDENLQTVISNIIDEYKIDVIVTSDSICSILDNFDNCNKITENDVHNFKLYRGDIPLRFEPYFLIKENGRNICVVIKSDLIDYDKIMLLNSETYYYDLLKIHNLPKVRLVDLFK